MSDDDPYSLDFNKQRFLIEASLCFSPLRSHAILTGISEGPSARLWSWPRFAATLRRRTSERLGVEIRHVWEWERDVCAVCGETGFAYHSAIR